MPWQKLILRLLKNLKRLCYSGSIPYILFKILYNFLYLMLPINKQITWTFMSLAQTTAYVRNFHYAIEIACNFVYLCNIIRIKVFAEGHSIVEVQLTKNSVGSVDLPPLAWLMNHLYDCIWPNDYIWTAYD